MRSSEHGSFRVDVHAVRAVAVVLVVVYHLGVGWFPGGFVGVDAFFVVSGFLITRQLSRELECRGRVSVLAFWARRVRRLAPSALIVLAVTGAAALALYPKEDWPKLGAQFAGSVGSVENWVLAASRTDYLAAGTPSTPFEHFWSLGVEEQFYIVWPILLLLIWRFAPRRPPLMWAVGAATGASLVGSVLLTALEPAAAYFWPYTRAWEFGAGALLALLGPQAGAFLPLASQTRAGAALLGWASLIAAGVLLSPGLPYPGILAAIPVVATALIIAAGAQTGVLGSVLRWRLVRWLGSISYPLYLWHWPVALLLPRAVELPSPVRIVATAALALILAQLTHVLVEDRVRFGPLSRRRPATVLAGAAGAMAVLLLVPTTGWVALQGQERQDREVAVTLSGDGCFGAAAAWNRSCRLNGDPRKPFTPATMTAAYDIDSTWDDCEAQTTAARSCVVGVRGGTRVALIGDSHAHQWSSTLTRIARQRGWELHLYVKGGCDFSHVRWSDVSDADQRRCAIWNDDVDRSLEAEAPYALVFTAARADLRGRPVGVDPNRAAQRGYRASWGPLIARGATILALRDTPAAGTGVQHCLDVNGDAVSRCQLSTTRAFAAKDYLTLAAQRIRGARVLDMTESFCRAGFCPAVIGNVLVYRDSQHITRTYANTLTRPLQRAINATLAPAPAATHGTVAAEVTRAGGHGRSSRRAVRCRREAQRRRRVPPDDRGAWRHACPT